VSTLQEIERAISQLSEQDLAALRHWFASYDAAAWDRQLDADVRLGKLDRFAEEALAEHRAGETTPL